jgi:hypothetical protein
MDKYNLNARFYPMVLFYMPVVLLAILFSFHFDNYKHLLTSFGVLGALSYFIKQIGRDAGKTREPSLWRSWDGAPTTQLLRWRNTAIDPNTKKRYHDRLQALCPVDEIPDPQLENNDPAKADEAYQAWAKFLITKTRDTKKYPLLFKENISYGFRRNLWGLKRYAIGLLILLMLITYMYEAISAKIFNPLDLPALFLEAELALAFLICFWVFIVKPSWVRIPANAYAERLLEAIENLKKEKK